MLWNDFSRKQDEKHSSRGFRFSFFLVNLQVISALQLPKYGWVCGFATRRQGKVRGQNTNQRSDNHIVILIL